MTLVLGLLLIARSEAATSTVGPGGACATPQACIDRLQPGDTLLITSGSYPGFAVGNLSGSSGAPITIKAAPGATVVLDGALGLGGPYGVITLDNPQYVTIGAPDGPMEVTFSDPWLAEIRALDMGSDADVSRWQSQYLGDPRVEIRGVHFTGGSTGSNVIIQNLTIHDVPALGIDNCPGQSQYLGNTIYNIGYPRSGYGFYCSGEGHVFQGNRIHDAAFGFHLYSESGSGLTNGVVDGNLVCTSGLKPWWHMSSSRVKHGGAAIHILPGQGNTVTNNLLAHNATVLSVFDDSATVQGNVLVGNQQDYDTGSRQDSRPGATTTLAAAGTDACMGSAAPTPATSPPARAGMPLPVKTLPAPRDLRLLRQSQ